MIGMSEREVKEKYEMHLAVSDLWLEPYVGRKINGRYDTFFDHNGYYPSDEEDKYPEYSENDIIINLHPHIKDGIIDSISYYKKIDNGFYSRHTIEKPLTSKDKKIFKNILDECTYSEAKVILNDIIRKPLTDGWLIKSVSDKSVTIQKGKEKINIPRDYIEFVIDVGRNNPDIINNRDFWHVNEKNLRIKYMEGLMILLAGFNKENYPDLILGKTAREKTEHDNKVIIAKESITNAIKNEEYEKVDQYIELLTRIPNSAVEAAAEKGNLTLLKKLSNKSDYYAFEQIGLSAIDSSNRSLLELVVASKGVMPKWTKHAFKNRKKDDLNYLLEKNGLLRIGYEDNDYSFEELLPLVKYHKVAWSLSYLKSFNELTDRKYITTALSNLYCVSGFDGYNMYDIENIVDWVIDCNSIELIDAVVHSGVRFSGQGYSDIFIKAFSRGEEYWKHAELLFADTSKECIRAYWNCVVQNDYDLLKKLMDYYNIGTPKDLVIRAIDPIPNDKRISKLIIEKYDKNVESDVESRAVIWKVFTRCKDDELFKLFFTTQSHIMNDIEVRNEITHDILWHFPSVSKAKFLVENFGIYDNYIKEVALATKISPYEIWSNTSAEVRDYNGSYIYIGEEDAKIEYIDDNTWEMKGSVIDYETGKNIEFHTRLTINTDGQPQFEVIDLRTK